MIPQRTPSAEPEAAIWAALAEVPDPEIPAISVVDLGVIHRVELAADRSTLRVELLPTFIGCPAIEMMREAIGVRLAELGIAERVVGTRVQQLRCGGADLISVEDHPSLLDWLEGFERLPAAGAMVDGAAQGRAERILKRGLP